MGFSRRFDIRQAGGAIALALALGAAANGAFFLAFVQPKMREYRELVDATQPLFNALEQRRGQVEGHEKFLAAARQAVTDLERIREEILSSRNQRLVEVQFELARLAEIFSIPVDSVGSSNELLLDEELDRYAMTVPLEGNYTSLRKFLQAVEQSDKFLVIERVALAQEEAGGSLLSLNISLATYFNAPEEILENRRILQSRSQRGRS
jgi:hypothetical protein